MGGGAAQVLGGDDGSCDPRVPGITREELHPAYAGCGDGYVTCDAAASGRG